MDLNTYLAFNGTCAEAFRFYERALEGKIEMMMTCGDSPMAETTPPEQKNRILHATLRVGDRTLQGADAPPQHFSKPQGFSVCYSAGSAEAATHGGSPPLCE